MKKEYDYLLVGAGLFNAVFAFMARQHGKLLSFSRFYLFVMVLIFLSSCDNRLNKALNEAENNQEELEKVLDYFKNDPETLKYSAARFLIENMPGHYSYSGAGIKQYESAYANMAHEAIQNKDSVFSIYWNQTDRDNISMSLDIKSIKADYLIAMINEACDMWRSSSWSKYYDINYFYDYVLPYRLLNEPLSLWRDSIYKEYSYLWKDEIRSIRGYNIEAENAVNSSCRSVISESASGHRALWFKKKNDSLQIDINSPVGARKSLYLCYSTNTINNRVTVRLNGNVQDTLYLTPTFSLSTFNSRRAWTDIELLQGANSIVIKNLQGDFCIDYIHLASIESVQETETDYSQNYYHIENKATKNVITFDTLCSSLLNKVEIRPIVEGDSCSFVRMDCAGYMCWKVCAYKKDTIDLCLDAFNYLPNPGTPIVQWKYVRGNNQKWIILPTGNGYCRIMNKDCGLFLESMTDMETGKEFIVQMPYNDSNRQQWKLIRLASRESSASVISFGSAIAEAYRIFDVMPLFEWFYFKGDYPLSISSLCKWKTGECRDETNYIVSLSRAKGIPAAIDFTPHWGNRSQSHTWSVLLAPNGKTVTFYMGAEPGDTTNIFHGYKKPKIFRRCYQFNQQIQHDLEKEKSIPELFRYPCFIDVTRDYCQTTDIVRKIPKEYKSRRVAYICVFDNAEWVPVHYGVISNTNVLFSSMARDIVYLIALYEKGKVVPIGNPFYVSSDGIIKDIIPDHHRETNLLLNRKYPFMGKEDLFNYRMWGGQFQGSNSPHFQKVATLYTFEGTTNGNWYEATINSSSKYKYLRYIGPHGSFCNINEIAFFNEKGKKITGSIIGSQGVDGASSEKVFDNNILTGFHSVNPDGGWVGLKLAKPECVGKIRFIPRNDGNCVEIGDEYELVYWDNGDWVSLGTQKAISDTLLFKNVPSNALYLLHDLTKGVEERIFTYQNGEQQWW